MYHFNCRQYSCYKAKTDLYRLQEVNMVLNVHRNHEAY